MGDSCAQTSRSVVWLHPPATRPPRGPPWPPRPAPPRAPPSTRRRRFVASFLFSFAFLLRILLIDPLFVVVVVVVVAVVVFVVGGFSFLVPPPSTTVERVCGGANRTRLDDRLTGFLRMV